MAHAVKVPKKSPAAERSPAEVAVQRRKAAAERARGMLGQLASGRSLSNELIAERRREARAEGRAEKRAARTKSRGAGR